MPENPYSNEAYKTYDPDEHKKARLKKILLILLCVLVAIAIIALLVHTSQPASQQDKYTQSATAAARKQIPDAKVTNVKVAGGFAQAIVSDPNADGQANAGTTTIFKVNQDGSMKQLASGSYFSPLDLLQLGIPLATQAKLTGSSTGQVRQNLLDECGSAEGSEGYSGFDGSFSPGEWQIDSATLSGLEQAVSNSINSQNANAKPDKTVICVNATQKNSDATTDTTTYISTFKLQVQFVTNDGTLSNHTVTFATGPNNYRNYTLDGQNIQ